MATTSILRVPGISRVGGDFLAALGELADRHGWNADGIAAVISHESGFNPAARNPTPGQTATGLLQFIESTAHRLGTSTAALATMTATEQLPFVEKFFRMALGGRLPTDPADYILATYGRADVIGAPDSHVLDRRDSTDPREAERYRVNASLDTAHKGWIDVGDLRRSVRRTIAAAQGERVLIPLAEPSTPCPSSGSASSPTSTGESSPDS